MLNSRRCHQTAGIALLKERRTPRLCTIGATLESRLRQSCGRYSGANRPTTLPVTRGSKHVRSRIDFLGRTRSVCCACHSWVGLAHNIRITRLSGCGSILWGPMGGIWAPVSTSRRLLAHLESLPDADDWLQIQRPRDYSNPNSCTLFAKSW
jgi:hypothetical protein